MEGFSINTAKSFLGKNVNLHLKDGSVIINVQLTEIWKDEFRRQKFVTCSSFRKKSPLKVPLKSVAWAEMLNPNIIPASCGGLSQRQNTQARLDACPLSVATANRKHS
jgi:hypothetical protein